MSDHRSTPLTDRTVGDPDAKPSWRIESLVAGGPGHRALAILSLTRLLADTDDLTSSGTFGVALRIAAPIAPRRALGPRRRTERHDQHRPRRHDGDGNDLRRVVGLAVRPVDGDPRRHRRRHDRRPGDERRHDHVRRQPHRRRRGDQHHRSRYRDDSWPSELFVDVQGGSITTSPGNKGSIGAFTVPFLSGGDLFGWTTPDITGLARGQGLVPDRRRRRPRQGPHHRGLVGRRADHRGRSSAWPICCGTHRSASGSGRPANGPPPPTRSA